MTPHTLLSLFYSALPGKLEEGSSQCDRVSIFSIWRAVQLLSRFPQSVRNLFPSYVQTHTYICLNKYWEAQLKGHSA